MQRTTSANNVGSLPSYASGGETPGYYTDLVSGGPGTAGTLVGAADMNMIQEEIVNVIEDIGGLTLDSADNTQMAKALGAFRTAAATTGSVTTARTRVVVAATGSTASGDKSAVIASAASTASGADSAVVSSNVGTASGNYSAVVSSSNGTASGEKSAVIASAASTASGAVSAVIASTGSYASGAGSVVIGGDNVEIGSTNTVGGGDNSGSGAITPSGSNQGLTWYVTGPGNVGCNNILVNGVPSMPNIPVYADEAAAVTGGIATGVVYRTATGELRIKL